MDLVIAKDTCGVVMRLLAFIVVLSIFLPGVAVSGDYGQDDLFTEPWGKSDNKKDDWSRTFNQKTHKDDTIRYDKPRRDSSFGNTWSTPKARNRTIGDIQRKQLQSRDDD